MPSKHKPPRTLLLTDKNKGVGGLKIKESNQHFVWKLHFILESEYVEEEQEEIIIQEHPQEQEHAQENRHNLSANKITVE